MKHFRSTVSAVVLIAGMIPLAAQEAESVEKLKQQMQSLREEFERAQLQQRLQMEALQRQLDALLAGRTNAPPAGPAASPTGPTTTPYSTASVTNVPPAPAWSPANPLQVAGRGGSYLNLSLDGLFAVGGSTAKDIERLQPGGHDPSQRGFTVQNLEAVFDGAIDPYFRGQANLVFQLDQRGETGVELEEAWLESISLPGGLQLRGGQILTEFGRLNPSHPHTWAFVDAPLVNSRFFGPDGLRNPGARISWLVPTPFYSELFLSIQNGQGGTAYSFRDDHEDELLFGRRHTAGRAVSMSDLIVTPRYAASFDLTDTQTVLAGASAAFGNNGSGDGMSTEIYGLDLFWKWKPAVNAGGFPFVSWQTEAMLRRYQAGAFAEDSDGDGINEIDLPTERLTDYGFYSQVSYGFRKGWITALRGEAVSGDRAAFYPDPDRDQRWRLSPDLTWFPSEFSKIRLQYNYDDRRNLGVDHSVWLQFEFLLGAHGAHKF